MALTLACAATAASAASDGPVAGQPNGFNAAYYLAQNPDVKAARVDPLQHWLTYGKWEGRAPYAGAPPFRPATPAEYASAPGCAIEVADAWAPAGVRQVRVRFRLTRFGQPCEMSRSIQAGASDPGSSDPATFNGVGRMNITWQSPIMAEPEALSLPSQGSQGEIVYNIPAAAGYFRAYVQSAEYNPRSVTGFLVIVGGNRPAGAQYNPDPLVLPAPTPMPDLASLGRPTYDTDFKTLDGWSFAPGVQLNAMIGVFTAPDWKTASGKLTNNYPIVGGVRQIVLRDHRSDPVQGKYPFSTGMMTHLLGDGTYGYRFADLDLPQPLPGTDAAYWGIMPNGQWPPEMDTHEGFASIANRLAQTVHMPVNGTPTVGFTPIVSVVGQHKWLELYSRTPTTVGTITTIWYRLWVDGRLVVERPSYLAGVPFNTTLSIEAVGGAGGSVDLTQHYDGMAMGLRRLAWWQL